MIDKIVRYSSKSRWHLFVVLCLFSWTVELLVLLYDVELFIGMFLGSLACSAVLAAFDKRKIFRRKTVID
jgi:hypothetical protein